MNQDTLGRQSLLASWVTLLAAAAGAQNAPDAPADLAVARRAHALELVRLSDDCIGNKLLNDADRLLRSALLLVPGDEDVRGRQQRLRELWISVNRDREKRAEYKKFWSSRDYGKACGDLRKREVKVVQAAVARYLEVADKTEANEPDRADAAYQMAFEADPESRALATRAGAERMKRLRDKRPGIEALKLGKTVVGKDVGLEQLRGKVVLWRSFSL